jgi:predicted nuclease of predicted toxin-antitoxin system
MKIKLDENLPARLKPLLSQLGHDVDTTQDEGLIGYADKEIWGSSQRESRFFITQDMDFSDLRLYAPGSHCGILLLRLHAPARSSLINRISELFRVENVSQWPRCFVVATELKVRVVRPSDQ